MGSPEDPRQIPGPVGDFVRADLRAAEDQLGIPTMLVFGAFAVAAAGVAKVISVFRKGESH